VKASISARDGAFRMNSSSDRSFAVRCHQGAGDGDVDAVLIGDRDGCDASDSASPVISAP
jgi:hypothetical protein